MSRGDPFPNPQLLLSGAGRGQRAGYKCRSAERGLRSGPEEVRAGELECYRDTATSACAVGAGDNGGEEFNRGSRRTWSTR